jgi:hypothetical protein
MPAKGVSACCCSPRGLAKTLLCWQQLTADSMDHHCHACPLLLKLKVLNAHRAVLDPEGLHDSVQQRAGIVSVQQPQVTSCTGEAEHGMSTTDTTNTPAAQHKGSELAGFCTLFHCSVCASNVCGLQQRIQTK